MNNSPRTRITILIMFLAVLVVLLSVSSVTAVSLTPIYEIQGAGHLSRLVDKGVTTEGIVTAVAIDGFFVQDVKGDGNDDTSDGMWVYMGSKCDDCPEVGEYIQLDGKVDEYIPGGSRTGNLSTTQMAFPKEIKVISREKQLPAPVIIGRSGRIAPNETVISESELPENLQKNPGVFNPEKDGIDFYESLEGMLVTIEDAVAVSAVRSFDKNSSELWALPNSGHPRIIKPSQARTERGGINLAAGADGYGDLNPERVQIEFDASDVASGTLYPATVPEITVGDRLGDVTGVVDYKYGNFEVRAIRKLTSGLAAEITSLLGSEEEVSIASYNVLNLSPLFDDDDQRRKLASQIVNNLGSPDVIALQEIQDNSGEVDDKVTGAEKTLKVLVEAIWMAGGPKYMAFDVEPTDGSSGGVPGGNIRNAFLYNSERVKLDRYVSLTPKELARADVINPDAFKGTRDPLAATFTFNGEHFTVINNHLSSRFGSTPIFGGPQPFLQEAEKNREAQVGALNEYVDYLLEGDKDYRVIVLGTFNTFEFTNDLAQILPGTQDGKAILTNLLEKTTDDNRYTFIFDGNSQVIDHMFVTGSLVKEAKFNIVHINVDFARRIRDITASDHEPIVGLFKLNGN